TGSLGPGCHCGREGCHDEIGEHQRRQADEKLARDVVERRTRQPRIHGADEEELYACNSKNSKNERWGQCPQRLRTGHALETNEARSKRKPRYRRAEIDKREYPGERRGKNAPAVQSAGKLFLESPLTGDDKRHRRSNRPGYRTSHHVLSSEGLICEAC